MVKAMKEDIEIQVNDYKMVGYLENKESEKLIIMLHGFTGNMQGPDNIYDKLSEKLQENGYAVLRFNFRGTPPSQMEFTEMTIESETEDFKEVLDFAKSKGYEKIGVLGESMGGTIALTGYNPGLDVVVFWYPAFDFTEDTLTDLLFSEKGQKSLKDNGYIEVWDGFKVGPEFVEENKDFVIYDKIKNVQCPVLFVHGDKDADVPVNQSEKAFELANEPKEIQIIKGADHGFKNEQDEVIELTIQFLKRHF